MENEMLCCCYNVSLKDVKDQIALGVDTFEELQSVTKIGSACDPCKEKNQKIFNQLLAQRT